MVSGCLESSLVCANCDSNKITNDQNDQIICSKCGSHIPCPECGGKLDHRKNVDEYGKVSDLAVCSQCNKSYQLN